MTLAKVICTGAGLLLFIYGARVDDAAYRWAGIALVAVAFLLRFAPGGKSRRRG